MARRAGGGIVGSIHMTGGAELERRLKALPGKIAKKLIRRALRSGAKIILAQAKANAPVDTGALKKSLKVRAAKRRGRGSVGVTVSTAEGDFKGDQFYASFIEYGHKRGKRPGKGATDAREEVPARPFMRPAFDEKKQEAVNVISSTLGAGIEQVAKEPA